MPTQKAAEVGAPLGRNAGWVHLAVTLVKSSPRATYPAQFPATPGPGPCSAWMVRRPRGTNAATAAVRQSRRDSRGGATTANGAASTISPMATIAAPSQSSLSADRVSPSTSRSARSAGGSER